MNLDILAAIILNAPGLLNMDISRSELRVSMVASGREYTVYATSARCTVHMCNSTPGANDGCEVARFYGNVEVTMQRAVDAVAAR